MSIHSITPVVLMVYNRPDITKQVMNQIANAKPPILYVLADGPKTLKEIVICKRTREIALNPSWNCKVIPFVQSENKGMVYQFKNGLEFVFKNHDTLIFLNDDSFVAPEFYKFSVEILRRFYKDTSVGHVNLTNLLPEKTSEFSYFLSKRPIIWGFATWKRVWESYDIQMPNWKNSEQWKLLNYYYSSNREKKAIKVLFDLHCNNNDPWTYDYQWDFNLMSNFMHSITPTYNLCYNIGFDRDDAFHTKSKNPFKNEIKAISKEIIHPDSIKLNSNYDRAITNLICPPTIIYYLLKIKFIILRIFFLLFKLLPTKP